VKPKVPSLDANLTPVEQMIAMMSALMAEGERGAESLAILISKIHPDLLADIVIANMKYLPKSSPPLVLRNGTYSANHQTGLPAGPPDVGPISVVAPPVVPAQVPISSLPETSVFSTDSKRDPRRDPRRFDPRRPAAVPAHVGEDNSNSVELEPDASSIPLNRSPENTQVPENEIVLYALESPAVSQPDEQAHMEEVLDKIDDTIAPDSEEAVDTHIQLPVLEVEQGFVAPNLSDFPIAKDTYSYSPEPEEISPLTITESVIEEISYPELPPVPLYIDMTEEQKRSIRKMAVERIIDSHKHMRGMDYHTQTRMTLLARLVAQIDADDDVVVMMQKHIISDYQQQKGHELVMHVLYHLYTLTISDSESQPSFAAIVYEKFLLGVARALLDSFPATDKSFSRLLGEVPFLPPSAFELLDEICCSERKDLSDGDRVTQGLGAVWSLILGRPINRQACLDIALKAAVLLQDDVRAKAIRLVANKLYMINYIAEDVEQFATNMLLSAVGSTAQKTEAEIGDQETSTSGSQISEAGNSENDPAKGPQSDSQSDSSVSFADAQRHISLFFALCIKKPSLLQLVFDNYARAPKAVKQAVHRHIPVLVRALGSSYSELLHIITDPPQGSEPLLSQVLQILSEGTIPSGELVAAVKRLYETKLKDATILIPILSSFSKAEVLPIFPRLVELPLDKFQIALAHILQGSAHTGPALTPAEVLVAIHAISPEKDGLPLKKITDVCSACFEQRTVFTQQVLAKALNQMVDQTPLPLLFMRTVIQAIDAFPALVDVVMEILSKLVSKQVWRMPKLWVGFLKCVSQTQPHSFRVLLQLPPQQLEGTLNKYSNLRGPLASYANQPSVKNSLPRPILLLLGLTSENHDHHPQSSLHSSDKNSSSVHGLT
jgi:symplekin